MKQIVMYVNQFFGGLGGESKADVHPQFSENLSGTSLSLNKSLTHACVSRQLICGDTYFASNTEEALDEIGKLLDSIEFDLFIAGPAFMSGRYGIACATVCDYVHKRYHLPAITCMYEENPGLTYNYPGIYILKGSSTAAGMRTDLENLGRFTDRIANGDTILWADAEGYFSHGIRKQILLPPEETAAKRAFAMLQKKLSGAPYISELPFHNPASVPIAPAIKDMSKARIAFITTGGIVPSDNPDHIPGAAASTFGRYDISSISTMDSGKWISVSGGYDQTYANADPMLVVPLDALKRLLEEQKIGYLHPWIYSTTGNQNNHENAKRMGQEILQYLKRDHIDGVIFGSC